MGEIFSNETRDKILTERLENIERCINNDENLREISIEFCRRAFKLLADCGLITEENVRFLASAESCKTYDPNLKFPYNASEGVLRKVERDDDVYDAKGYQRFYRGDKMCVVCGDDKYLIATNWFGDGSGLPSNRRAFYNWVALQIEATLKNC